MKRSGVMQHRTFSSIATLAVLVTVTVPAACARRADNAATQTPSKQPAVTRSEVTAANPAGPPAGVTTFATPEAAVDALIAAGEKPDNAALLAVLGPDSADLLSSGDAVADQRARAAFRARYKAYHQLVAGSPDQLVLMTGEDRWPLPIPLVRTNGRWWWNAAAGAQELVMRRIGADELRTIEVMRGVVEAENDYALTGHDGEPAGLYARRLRSTPGKEDGLYWQIKRGEPQSPAGPLLAAASAEGYAMQGGGTAPYHGYLYRVLTSQGPAASGGVRDYLTDGKLNGGFAVLAYPASYGSSGIMTFMVNQDGVVWQRDLGEDTAQAAAAISQFNPDQHWTPLAPES
jgi:hypothetical protein